jgi:hypothetical protein
VTYLGTDLHADRSRGPTAIIATTINIVATTINIVATTINAVADLAHEPGRLSMSSGLRGALPRVRSARRRPTGS